MANNKFCIVGIAVIALLLTFASSKKLQETRELEEEDVEECEAGEHYMECGSECPVACYNLGQPRACGLRCKAGCFCDEGLVRNPDGACVPPNHCPRYEQ